MTLAQVVTNSNNLTTAINAADVEASDLRDSAGEAGLYSAISDLYVAVGNLLHLAGGAPRPQLAIRPVDAI